MFDPGRCAWRTRRNRPGDPHVRRRVLTGTAAARRHYRRMRSDDDVLRLMQECNALLKLQGQFHEQVVKGRLEVAFSKLQSTGSGADIRYVPRHISASTVLNNKNEIVNSASAWSSAESEADSKQDSMSWFGDNPHPKVRTAQGYFERALALCAQLLAARRDYERKWLR